MLKDKFALEFYQNEEILTFAEIIKISKKKKNQETFPKIDHSDYVTLNNLLNNTTKFDSETELEDDEDVIVIDHFEENKANDQKIVENLSLYSLSTLKFDTKLNDEVNYFHLFNF